MTRKLPVYLLVDSSGSMQGEPIQAVNVGIGAMLSALRQDPYALETVSISVITFDVAVKKILTMTPIDEALVDEISLPRSGATHLGEALEFLLADMEDNVTKNADGVKGDFRPMLFIMTDGSPSDVQVFNQVVPKIKSAGFASIIACAAGPKATTSHLKQITDNVVVLEAMDSSSFAAFFKWVSDSVAAGSINSDIEAGNGPNLPPPPPEIELTL